MPTTNYDASLLTQRKRSLALYTFYTQNNAAVNAGTSVRREQPDTQLATVVTQRRETAANTNPTGANGCPCSTAVDNNEGGNNSKNVK